ncbi:MAG TPA: HAD-IIA family hydrolase [Acidimicrobiia bacterium]|nr:HAD-IIA family hydrolase [Acidimicrobiia bacterium]
MSGGIDRPVVCCDLDGVIWRGQEPIAGASDGIAQLRDAGLRVGFVSNNSSQPVGEVVAKLAAAGVPAADDDVITSALAAASLLEGSLEPNASVLACAGPGVVEALTGAGLRVVDRSPADAVVVGLHRDFDFDELDRASAAVREGARFVATNLDATYPVAGGLIPGSGAIAAAVATASGRAPEVAGKPEPPMVALVRERLGATGVVVGDRPTSDGALAAALGWPFALVLSGVTGREVGLGGEAIPDPEPPFVADDLGSLAPRLVAAFATG